MIWRGLGWCALPVVLAGCDASTTQAPLVEFRAGQPVDAFTPRDSGMQEAGAGGGAGGDTGASDAAVAGDAGVAEGGAGPSALTVQYLTHSQGGRFAPRNVGAAWIERDDGVWIKTLDVWATLRARYLSRFNTACGGNRVDAISGATLNQHQLHTNSWDLRDVHGNLVPQGAYRVVIEVTDANRTGTSIELPFTIDATWTEATRYPSTAFYSDLMMSWR